MSSMNRKEFLAVTGSLLAGQLLARAQSVTAHDAVNVGLIGVGLFHIDTSHQLFDNFRVWDPKGMPIFADGFDGSDVLPAGWKLIGSSVYRGVERGLGPQLDAVGWHPFYGADPDSPAYRSYRQD